MKRLDNLATPVWRLMALLTTVLVTGCDIGGGQGTILGSAVSGTAPFVTAVAPVPNASGVPISTKVISAVFNKAMDPATLTTASFTLACPVDTAVSGTVGYLALSNTATLTLATNLPPSTTCTATVTTAAKDTTGIPLAAKFVWTFRTGVTPDVTRPRVTLTAPGTTIPGPTLGAVANAAISAVFNEDMDPASFATASTFSVTCGPGNTLPCVSPSPLGGAAIYAVGSRTATYSPTTALAGSTTYTAVITTAATDLSRNALAGNQAALPAASNYVWTFTTAAAAIPPLPITVNSTFPVSGAAGVCPNATINATFNPSAIRMNDLSVAANFSVTGPASSVITPASVVLDGQTGRIATFTPLSPLPVGSYTAKITGGASGVKDLAIPANTMNSDSKWSFTVVSCAAPPPSPFPLGLASTFGSVSCAALSGSTVGTGTTVNGDIGTKLTSTSITNWFGGGSPATPGVVNGTIFASDLPSAGNTTTSTAVGDANAAFLAAQIVGASGAVIPTSDLGALAGFGPNPLTPGTFKAGAYRSGSSIAISTPLTLDAQGDANAVWVFYSLDSTLTTTGPLGNIVLINNAQAKNVFWVVGSSATLGAPLFSGNVLAATSITVASPAGGIIDGRLLTSGPTCAAVSFTGSVAGTVNVPAP